MTEAPPPPVPQDLDLRDFKGMHFDLHRLRASKAWRMAKREPELAFYMMNLWMASWHEVPASSLENDDIDLCDTAGCDPKRWPKIRDKVLRGFQICSDGKLYHPVVAEMALMAWESKKEAQTERAKQADKMRAWRAAKAAHSNGHGPDGPGGRSHYVPENEPSRSQSRDPSRNGNTAARNGNNGQCNGNGNSYAAATSELRSDDVTSLNRKEEKGREEVHTSMYVPGTQDSRARAEPAPPPEQRNMPRLGDSPAAWVPIAGGFELDDGMCGPVKKPVVNGFYLDEMAELVCSAAGISQRGYSDNWLILCSWLNAGYCPHRQIAPEIKRVDALRRSSLRSKGQSESRVDSIVYFDKPVRKLVPMLTPLHGRNVA